MIILLSNEQQQPQGCSMVLVKLSCQLCSLSDVCTPSNSFAIVDVMMGFFKHQFSTLFVSLLSLEKFLGS
jgi:hypothetical protein